MSSWLNEILKVVAGMLIGGGVSYFVAQNVVNIGGEVNTYAGDTLKEAEKAKGE